MISYWRLGYWSMHPDEFYRTRKVDWEKLTRLVRSQPEWRRWGLSPDDVHTLGQLYRLATSDLALAQRDFPDHRVAHI